MNFTVRIILMGAVLILVGAGLAYFISTLGNATNNNQNLTISVSDPTVTLQQQQSIQQGSQEGDTALYTQYVSQLVLGRLGQEQPVTNEAGEVVYRPEDQLTFTLMTPDSVTTPFKIRHEVYSSSGDRLAKSEELDFNPGVNTSCCVQVPDTAGSYTLRFYLNDQLFAARYFAVK